MMSWQNEGGELSKRYFYGYGGCLAELVEGKWGRKGSLGI